MKKQLLFTLLILCAVFTSKAQILDVTFDATYATNQGWTTWQEVQSGDLPAGFDFIFTVGDAKTTPLWIGNTTYPLWFGGTEWFVGDDAWFTYDATGLTIGNSYEVTVIVGSDSGQTVNLGLAAWETGSTPAVQYLASNAILIDYAASTPVGTEMKMSFVATAANMTFGIGQGDQAAADPGYNYIQRTIISSWRIEDIGAAASVSDYANIIGAYPNPASTFVTLNNIETGSSIKVYSLTGALVKDLTVSGDKTIDVSDLVSGMYVIQADKGYGRLIVE